MSAAVPPTSNASLTLESAVQSKFYVLNGEGISPKATSSSRWKITHISDILHETGCFIPFMSITETWLKGYITDSQVEIPDFNVYRADRSAIKRGGALLYVHNSLIVSRESFSDDGVCQSVLLTIDSLNTVVASIYRLPAYLGLNCPASRKYSRLSRTIWIILETTMFTLLETSTSRTSTGKP